ncbi:hypothetical protein [Microbacterium sp. NPDC096154]|uniref:hypothetical protein n=1 Tax=Microbacterium sp. NPDC096154 TaxID=3155549 RepID=UPI0033324C14
MAWTRRTTLVTGIAAVLTVVIGGGIAWAVIAPADPETSPSASATATASATPKPTPTSEPDAPLARSAMFRGSVDGWQLAPDTAIAAVLPEAGSAHGGAVSLGVDAPVVAQSTVAAAVPVTVVPGADYLLEAWVRVQSVRPVAVKAAFTVGDVVRPLPELNAAWQKVSYPISAPADGAAETQVALQLDAPVLGLSVDDITLTPAGGQSVVPNGGFEAVEVPQSVIVNDSLVFESSLATIVAALPQGEATWRVTTTSGEEVAGGTVPVQSAVAGIPLADVPQGYFSFVVADASGRSVSTPIVVVDAAGSALPTDSRFGITAQFDRAQHARGGRIARSLGFGEVRTDILWRLNELRRGEYTWDQRYTTEIPRARANGVAVLGTANYANPLYDGGHTPTSPEAVEAFGRYAGEMARAFDLSGVEVFNEFNQKRFVTGSCGSAPECYLPLLESAHRHVGAVKADLPIVTGATALYDGAWFDRLWQLGGMKYTDAMSFHPYEVVYSNVHNLDKIIGAARKSMRENAGSESAIWMSELGWTTKTGDVTEAQQGMQFVRAATITLSRGVEKFMWYDVVNDGGGPAEHEGNFGLFAPPRAGVLAPAPKQSALSAGLLITKIAGKPYAAREEGAGVRSEVFGEETAPTRVAWAPAGGDVTATYEADGPVYVTSLQGEVQALEPKNGRVTIEVGESPKLITGNVTAAAF